MKLKIIIFTTMFLALFGVVPATAAVTPSTTTTVSPWQKCAVPSDIDYNVRITFTNTISGITMVSKPTRVEWKGGIIFLSTEVGVVRATYWSNSNPSYKVNTGWANVSPNSLSGGFSGSLPVAAPKYLPRPVSAYATLAYVGYNGNIIDICSSTTTTSK